MVKKNENAKKALYVGAAIFIIGLVAMQLGLLTGIGIRPWGAPSQSGYNIPEGTSVYCKITTRIMLGLTTTDLAVNMYSMDGKFVDTCTTSTGVGTFSTMMTVGTHVLLQARQAAPATSDPYVTPTEEYVVPSAGQSADTVALQSVVTGEAILWCRDISASNPTMSIRNGFDNNTISSAQNYLNTTDYAFKVTITVVSSNCYYGCPDFTDMISGNVYRGGVWVVWKGLAQQNFANYDYTFSDPTNIYYIWKISDGIWYDSNAQTFTSRSCSAYISIVNPADTFNADATVIIDVFDMMYLVGGTVGSAGCFVDGGSTGVAAITTKIA
jgi:hypothetical protein